MNFYPMMKGLRLLLAMRTIKTDMESATGYSPGFYNVKGRYFLVTTAEGGLPRVFKTYIPQREFSSMPHLAMKTLLFPLAVAGDIVTSPAQLVIYIMVANSSLMM